MKSLYSYCKILIVSILLINVQHNLFAADGKTEIYTPYTKVSVSPGSTVNYSMDIINNNPYTINESVSIVNIPRSWNYTLTASGMNVNKVAVLESKKETLKLKIEVPYHVKKGYYTFYAKLGSMASLPLIINVTTAGSNETELSCDQKNMEGTSKSDFAFNAVLKNKTANKQQYALMASPPKGWNVIIKPNYKQATSTEIDANGTKNINYTIKAPYNVKAGTYKIPVKAVSGSTSADMELEVVITGTYEMSFSTPTGLLSAKVTAGDEKKIELVVKNTGSTKLENIDLSASKPKNWEVSFDTKKIEHLEPGKTARIYATIKADKKAIPGDYVTKVTAKTSETNQNLSFRIMVKTPLLMGWLGVLIILISVGGIAFLMTKFGRR
ncbi:NEW3 domain-containing protein [Saccharicrinis aurantiacus]|uniref:COG1470 family protein n=1 Tax=Saccharicrinis aurantiacus TaxID=1849719 RepID=UPI002492FB4A|nr:NEW3 domain-containing protein [Saccharicrinis aurantiacus]